VLQTMMALDPAKRYPSAQAAIEDLERVLRRHTMTTTIVSAGAGEKGKRSAPAVSPTASPLPPVPVEPHPVEKVLGLDLLKAPMQEARRLADQLADPQEVAALLDQWSREGLFRRKLLGRQARVRRVQTQNIYFYTLRVLYETREPERLVEEPDYKAAPIPREKALDRWALELPSPKGFADEPGGTVRLPGSTRVISCSPCQGVGRLPCPRCKGGGRVVVARSSPGAGASGRGARRAAATTVSGGVKAAAAPAAGAAGGQAEALTAGATALVPCPDCQGTGGLKCEQCDGVGRLMQHKTVKWQRRATELKDNDDLPRVDEQWLHRVCKARDVYRERQQGGFRPEWSLVPGLDELVKSAEKRLDQNTRVAMSEVSIAFIPVTEIVFDLGDVRQKPSLKPAAQRGQSPPAADAGLYRWHIYGFERRLPKDWRFLNWDRVAALILAGVVVLLIILIVLLVLL